MMQIAKVSLFLAGSAAFTSAVRVTSRGRRMQPSNDEESKQPTTTQQACSVIASKSSDHRVADDMAHMIGANVPVPIVGSRLNFQELKDIAKDFLTERLKQLDSYVAAHDMANGSIHIGANWMNQPNAAEAMACAAVTRQLSTQRMADMATRNQMAEEMATMLGSGFHMGHNQLTLKMLKDISSEFLQRLAARVDSVPYANANAFGNANPNGAPNPYQASQQILSTKAMDKDINQDLEREKIRQKIAEEMVPKMGASFGGL